jgi:hypothetical protein
MTTFKDILTFRKMIAPIFLQVLFWGTIGGTLFGTYVLFSMGNWAWPVPLIFGTLGTRVLFETLILAFRAYDRQCDILAELVKLNAKAP